MKFADDVREYLYEKNIEHELQAGTTTCHIKVKEVQKKFYLEVLLPEFRHLGRPYGMHPTGTTFFTGHIYIRFFKGA